MSLEQVKLTQYLKKLTLDIWDNVNIRFKASGQNLLLIQVSAFIIR